MAGAPGLNRARRRASCGVPPDTGPLLRHKWQDLEALTSVVGERRWQMKAEELAGSYLLRTTRQETSAEEIWRSHVLLTRLESACPTMETPLAERPRPSTDGRRVTSTKSCTDSGAGGGTTRDPWRPGQDSRSITSPRRIRPVPSGRAGCCRAARPASMAKRSSEDYSSRTSKWGGQRGRHRRSRTARRVAD